MKTTKTTPKVTRRKTAEIVPLEPPQDLNAEEALGQMRNEVLAGMVDKVVVLGVASDGSYFSMVRSTMPIMEMNWILDNAKTNLLVHGMDEDEEE